MPKISDAPVAYYLVKNLTTGAITQLRPSALTTLSISGLAALTSYTFSITAVSIDGRSQSSLITPAITTTAIPVVAPALAAPAFTLSSSSSSESRVVNTVATGFTIASTGGAIASYAISETPAGMSFSTSTGALSGTPTTVAGATTYTITATNGSGSATQTFSFTVTAFVYSIGSTGPGGGKIFYYLAAGFNCGSGFTTTGSPTGGLCHYLEAAPTTGTSSWTDIAYAWSGNTANAIGTTGTAIGTGYKNTLAMIAQSNTANRAGTKSRTYVGPNGLIDWYLPSKDELNQMCKWQRGVLWVSDATVCSDGALNTGSGAAGFMAERYWSSSENDAGLAWRQYLSDGIQDAGAKDGTRYIRPVRAF